MQATITVGKEIKDRIEQQIERRTFGRPETKMVKVGEDIAYTVALSLDLTEEERSTILTYGLGEITLEDFARFTQDDVDRAVRDGQDRVEAISGTSQRAFNERAISESVNETAQQLMRHERVIVRVADFFTNPYIRSFKTYYEAITYARNLKMKLLPRLRQLIDEVRSVPQTETFLV